MKLKTYLMSGVAITKNDKENILDPYSKKEHLKI